MRTRTINAEGSDGHIAVHAVDLAAIKAILHDLKPKQTNYSKS
jgi:hypothetical protein